MRYRCSAVYHCKPGGSTPKEHVYNILYQGEGFTLSFFVCEIKISLTVVCGSFPVLCIASQRRVTGLEIGTVNPFSRKTYRVTLQIRPCTINIFFQRRIHKSKVCPPHSRRCCCAIVDNRGFLVSIINTRLFCPAYKVICLYF